MTYNANDYASVIDAFTTYYNTTSQAAWDVINQYNLSPQEFANMIPKDTIAQGADGIYRVYNSAGSVSSTVYQQTAPMGTGNVAQSAINSNAQTGTAAVTEKTRWAGNSVIDENGKIKTSSGVTKYDNGTAGTAGGTKAILGSVTSAVAATVTGLRLGKTLSSGIYAVGSSLFPGKDWSSYDPTTWASITRDMSDTGIEGVFKKAFNYLIVPDGNGGSQGYIEKDAFNYFAYALAKSGLFDSGGKESSKSVSGLSPTYMRNLSPTSIPVYSASSIQVYARTSSSAQWYLYNSYSVTSGNPVATTIISSDGGKCGVFASTENFSLLRTTYKPNGSVQYTTPVSASSGYVTDGGVRKNFYWVYIGWTPQNSVNTDITPTGITCNKYFQSNSGGGTSDRLYTEGLNVYAYILCYGTITEHATIPGTGNQQGATVPTGIDSSSSQTDVTNAIAQQYPDLEDNKIEQTVVQPDGTVKTIVYYPVPIPSDTTDVVLDEDTPITVDDPIDVVIPDGETVTLPDGSTITGDGVTIIVLPVGQYILPVETIIKDMPVGEDGDPGSTQTSMTVTNNSTEVSKQTIINIIVSPQPQTTSDTAVDTSTDVSTDTATDNPTDTGDGNTPPVVVPVGSASALWTVYNPTQAQLDALGGWLWSSDFVDQILKAFNNPMEAIIGLHKIFIPPITGTAQNIRVGYLDSGVSSLTVPSQYNTVDCGTISLPEYFGNVFDYSPYTRVYIYLPFIGFKELDVAQVMRSSINVKYHGDMYTGTGLCEISVSRDAGAGGVLYSFGCECSVRYPLSSGSYLGIVGAAVGIVTAVGGIATANPMMVAGGVSSALNKHASYERSGGFSGNSGAMGIKKPYLVIMRPQTAMPNRYLHYSGAPSSSYIKIANTTGLIRVRECHVDSIPYATKEEKSMIEKLLYEGVIV